MKLLSKFFTITMMLLAFTSNVNAQGGGNVDGGHTGETGFNVTEGSGSEGGNCGNGPHTHAGNAKCPNKGGDSIPLDGGISFLLAAAAFFGIKKLRGNKNNTI
jgi:hypothetical protein